MVYIVMGNSGNASPTFSILDYGPASDDSSSPPDEVTPEKDPNEPDSIGRSERLLDFEGPPTPPLCKKRHPGSNGGSPASQGLDSTSNGGSNKQC